MAQPQPEKRTTRRFSLDLPISVKFLNNGQRELAGHTRDVSSRGVFMYLETEITTGRANRICDDAAAGNYAGRSYPRALHGKDTQGGQSSGGSRHRRSN